MIASVDMQVLAVLRWAEALGTGTWLIPSEIGTYTQGSQSPRGVTSAIRRLRGKGFNIKRCKRVGRIDEYKLFSAEAK